MYATSSALLPRIESLPFVIFTPACISSIPETLRDAEFPISSAPTVRTEFVALFSINFSPTIVTASPQLQMPAY